MGDEEKQISMNDVLFIALVRDFESMAMVGFGKLVDPATQKAERNLDRAKVAIDMLGMLEEKTKGNLNETQAALVRQVLTNLRLNYVDELEKEKDERESEAKARATAGGKGAEDQAAEKGEADAAKKAEAQTSEKAGTQAAKEKAERGGERSAKAHATVGENSAEAHAARKAETQTAKRKAKPRKSGSG